MHRGQKLSHKLRSVFQLYCPGLSTGHVRNLSFFAAMFLRVGILWVGKLAGGVLRNGHPQVFRLGRIPVSEVHALTRNCLAAREKMRLWETAAAT